VFARGGRPEDKNRLVCRKKEIDREVRSQKKRGTRFLRKEGTWDKKIEKSTGKKQGQTPTKTLRRKGDPQERHQGGRPKRPSRKDQKSLSKPPVGGGHRKEL